MQEEMWEWIIKNLNKLIKENDINSIKAHLETDDVKSEVCMVLLQDKSMAEAIYQKRNTAYLNKMIKHTIYEMKSRHHFKNKVEFSRFQRIQLVCEKYGIDMIPANAYKISHIMEHDNYSTEEFSIVHIIKILKEYKEDDILLKYELAEGDNND